LQNRARVTACFFGEGAAAEGAFHESLNLAALWKLPVLFVCENNFYAMGTALERSESQTDIRRHAESYNVPGAVVDGMDVVAVEVAATRAVASIRESGTPYFLENRTYRFRAHSMFDPELYRDKAEVEHAKERDPIHLFQNWGLTAGLLHDADVKAIEQDVAAEIEDSVAFAEAAPWEPVEDLLRDVHTPVTVQAAE